MIQYQYEILLSSASDTTGELVAGTFPTHAVAVDRAEAICRAQPGVEVELVSRALGKDPWRSATGETPRQVMDRRWI